MGLFVPWCRQCSTHSSGMSTKQEKKLCFFSWVVFVFQHSYLIDISGFTTVRAESGCHATAQTCGQSLWQIHLICLHYHSEPCDPSSFLDFRFSLKIGRKSFCWYQSIELKYSLLKSIFTCRKRWYSKWQHKNAFYHNITSHHKKPVCYNPPASCKSFLTPF